MKAEIKLLLLAAAFSGGCTLALKAEAPEGWPELERFEHFNVAHEDMERACGLRNIVACAVVDLCKRTCTKYYTEGYNTGFVREHEEGHCQGRDHPGERTFEELFKRGCER